MAYKHANIKQQPQRHRHRHRHRQWFVEHRRSRRRTEETMRRLVRRVRPWVTVGSCRNMTAKALWPQELLQVIRASELDLLPACTWFFNMYIFHKAACFTLIIIKLVLGSQFNVHFVAPASYQDLCWGYDNHNNNNNAAATAFCHDASTSRHSLCGWGSPGNCGWLPRWLLADRRLSSDRERERERQLPVAAPTPTRSNYLPLPSTSSAAVFTRCSCNNFRRFLHFIITKQKPQLGRCPPVYPTSPSTTSSAWCILCWLSCRCSTLFTCFVSLRKSSAVSHAVTLSLGQLLASSVCLSAWQTQERMLQLSFLQAWAWLWQ